MPFKRSTILVFASNAKSFAIVIIFFFLFFSKANLDELAKAACRIFYIFSARKVRLNSDIPKKLYVRNVH